MSTKAVVVMHRHSRPAAVRTSAAAAQVRAQTLNRFLFLQESEDRGSSDDVDTSPLGEGSVRRGEMLLHCMMSPEHGQLSQIHGRVITYIVAIPASVVRQWPLVLHGPHRWLICMYSPVLVRPHLETIHDLIASRRWVAQLRARLAHTLQVPRTFLGGTPAQKQGLPWLLSR